MEAIHQLSESIRQLEDAHREFGKICIIVDVLYGNERIREIEYLINKLKNQLMIYQRSIEKME